jgi:hypothetical protein
MLNGGDNEGHDVPPLTRVATRLVAAALIGAIDAMLVVRLLRRATGRLREQHRRLMDPDRDTDDIGSRA